MKKDKLVYEAPEAEIFEVRFAENMLGVTSPNLGPGSGYNTLGNAGNDMTEDDDYTYSF